MGNHALIWNEHGEMVENIIEILEEKEGDKSSITTRWSNELKASIIPEIHTR